MESANTIRTAIIVLGMHRSGTSALTRVISHLGAALPKNLMGADHGNDTGHWEPARLVDVHDKLLSEAGSKWDDWRGLDLSVINDDRLRYYRAAIRDLLTEEYKDKNLIVIKDPRICRFPKFYADILSDLGYKSHYALPVRNPLAVASSLAKRNGMTFSSTKMLWLRHAIDAEFATRGHSRCFVSYEDMLTDWRSAAERIGLSLEIAWPRHPDEAASEIQQFLSPSLQHHRYMVSDLEGDGPFDTWLRRAYLHLRELESDPSSQSHMSTLDELRGEINEFTQRAGELTYPEMKRRDDDLAEVNRICGQLRASLEAETAAKSELENQVASVSEALAEARSDISATVTQLHSKQAETETLTAQLHSKQAETETLTAQLHSAQQDIKSLKSSTSWRLTAPIRAIRTAIARL